MNRVLATDRQHIAGVPLPAITDEVMHERLRAARPYTVVLLHATGKLVRPDADPIIWEHGRRNFALREHGVLPIVLPATDDNDLAGLYIFNAHPDDVRAIMDHDPGLAAGIFTCEIHPVRGFPGSCLPEQEPAFSAYRDPADCDPTEQGAPPDPAVTGPRGPRPVTPPGHV